MKTEVAPGVPAAEQGNLFGGGFSVGDPRLAVGVWIKYRHLRVDGRKRAIVRETLKGRIEMIDRLGLMKVRCAASFEAHTIEASRVVEVFEHKPDVNRWWA